MASIFGTGTDDTLASTSGDDTLKGYAGSDSITGGDGNDVIFGDQAAEPGTVTNGDFSSATGWTLDSSAGGVGIGSGILAFNGANTTAGGIASTDISTTPNHEYTVTLDMAEFGAGNGRHFLRIEIVDADGNVIATSTFDVKNGESKSVSVTYTATTETTTIRLTNTNVTNTNGSDLRLDNVVNTLITVADTDFNDTLDGGGGDDTLTGGAGDDIFVWDGGSNDLITDFRNGSDFVDLSGTFNATTLAAYNAANGTSFVHPIQALRHDMLDGQVDFNGTDMSGPTLTFQGGALDLLNSETAVICFTKSTIIKTIDGEIPVEQLHPGNQVLTRDNGYKPILWIGGRRIPPERLEREPNLRPIRLRAHSLGPGWPETDLLVSPQHRMLVLSGMARELMGETEVLIAAKHLTALPGVEVNESNQPLEYWHFLFYQHEIVNANGAWAESLFPGKEALKSVPVEAAEELFRIFPELEQWTENLGQLARLVPKGRTRKLIVQHAVEGVE